MHFSTHGKDKRVPTTNFKHEKRQKDIQKKKKRDEKIQRRQGKKPNQPSETPTAALPVEKKEEIPG